MSKQRNVLKLDPDEQLSWLNQHLPNRIGAAWVRLTEMKGEWEWKQHSDFVKNNQVWCIDRAAELGQKAAMRCLIEFVGIALSKEDKKKNKKGIPCRPTEYDGDTDVSIQSFVADGSDRQIPLEPIDIQDESSRAWVLAKVWKGCTQSCGHLTFKTKHPSADPPELAVALTIIVEHLQAQLYTPSGGKRLSEIVKEQQ
jgi:hypothetical protein